MASPLKLPANMEKLRQAKLMLATPSYNGYHEAFTQSLMATMHLFIKLGLNFMHSPWAGDSLIPRARNRMAHHFLYGTDCTHLLFKDTDQSWEPEDIVTMLSLDLPISGALYAKKSINWERVAEAVKRGVPAEKLKLIASDYVCNFLSPELKVNEPVPVRHLGNGSMMIQREVLEKMVETFPESRYDPTDDEKALVQGGAKYLFDFFGIGPDPEIPLGQGKAYLSEDWWFCMRASKLGYKLWLLPWMKTVHYGQCAYVSDLNAMLEAGLMM